MNANEHATTGILKSCQDARNASGTNAVLPLYLDEAYLRRLRITCGADYREEAWQR
jgi:hypothetical protein